MILSFVAKTTEKLPSLIQSLKPFGSIDSVNKIILFKDWSFISRRTCHLFPLLLSFNASETSPSRAKLEMQNKMCNLLPEMVSLFLLSFAFKISSSLATKGEGKLQTYIVFLEKPERAVLMRPKELDRWYQTFLPASALKSNQPHILYSYRNVIVGFAAKITARQVKFMERKRGFVSARPEKMFSPHNSYSQLLGFATQYRILELLQLWEGSHYRTSGHWNNT